MNVLPNTSAFGLLLRNELGSPRTTGFAKSAGVLLYGAFDQFVIADRIGTTFEFIQNLVGANRRPTGQRGVLMWFRTGSDSVNNNAFRLLNVATTA